MRWNASSQRLTAALTTLILIAGCSKDPEKVKREYFESAQEFAKKGEVQQAVLQYRNAIQVDPKYGEARLALGTLLMSQQATAPAAYPELIRAADLLPRSIDAQLRAAEILLLAGKYDDATSRAEKALAIDPKNIRAQLLKANAMAGLKHFDDAIAQVESTIALDPSQSDSYKSLGILQLAKGNNPEAEAALKRAVEVAPKQMEPRISLATFYLATKQVPLAESTLAMALQEQPRNPDVNRAIATLFLVTGRPDKAEAPLKIVTEERKDLPSQLTLADYYRTVQRDDDALRILDSAAEGKGGFGPAMTRKAAILRQQGKKDSAYATLEEVIEKEPKDAEALILKAMFLADDGKLDSALSTSEAAVRAKSSAAAQFVLGRIQQKRGALPAATAAYLETLKFQPSHTEALRRLAEIALGDLRLEDARRYAQDALRLRPDYPEALVIQARADMGLGNLSGAQDTLKGLSERYPKSAVVHAQLGTLYAAKKDLQGARVSYERALSFDPIALEPIAGLMALDLQSGKPAAARARVDAALARTPRSPALLVIAAQAYMATGDAPKAEEMLRSAISIDPSQLQAYGMLARIYVSQKRIDAAIAELEQVAKKQPEGIAAPTLIGMLLEQQNKTNEAQTRYEEIVRAHKSAAIASNNLAWIYTENSGNLDAALALAQTAKAALPDSADVSDTLGWIYFKKKMLPQALTSLKEASARDPKNTLIQYHLGLAYASNSEYALAKPILSAALKADPNSPSAGDAKAALNLIAAIGL
jgi:tetratricopeptide (TPR) repeat protein